jgi:hypothetical protein
MTNSPEPDITLSDVELDIWFELVYLPPDYDVDDNHCMSDESDIVPNSLNQHFPPSFIETIEMVQKLQNQEDADFQVIVCDKCLKPADVLVPIIYDNGHIYGICHWCTETPN